MSSSKVYRVKRSKDDMEYFANSGSSSFSFKEESETPGRRKNFECTICNTRFFQKQTLKQHVLTHTGHRPYQCSLCEKSFTQKGSLDRHAKLHDDQPKLFSCQLCSSSFRQPNNLKRHLRLHDSTPTHQCDICFRRFARKEGLMRHVKTHLPKYEKLYCHCCGRAFAEPASLLQHVKWVDGGGHCTISNTTCSCALCQKRSQNHTDCVGLATHECKLCAETFAREASLKKHYLCHRHEVEDLNEYVRVYQCHYCKQLSTSRPRIIRHVRKHTEPSEPKIIKIVGGSVFDEKVKEIRLPNTSSNFENIPDRADARIQKKSKPLPLFPNFLRALLTSSGVNPKKRCDQVAQSKKDVTIEKKFDYKVKSIISEAFNELPTETDVKDSNINVVCDNNEPVTVLYKDWFIKEEKPSEDELAKEEDINEMSSGKSEEEVFSDLSYDEDCMLDDIEEEIYDESLISGETSKSDDNIEIKYDDQMLTDELSREIKLEEHHFEEYGEDQESNEKEDIHNYDMVETSSFLLEERTTSAPNSPPMIDDFDLSETFDSEPPTGDEKVATIPNPKSLQISLETIKCLVRDSSDAPSNKSTRKNVTGSLPPGTILSSSNQNLAETPDTAEVEYVKVLPDEALFVHNRIVHKEGKHFYCYVCKKTYKSKNSLKRHFRVTHTTHEKKQCSLCSKTFQTADALRKHVRALHAPHRFLCSVCQKTFNRKDALASHQRLHSGDRPFACPACGERFAQKQNLHAHSKKHLREKPFTCDICGKGFCAKTSMRRHVLVHTGERKFRCHVCDKAFQQKAHLDNHLATHGIIDESRLFECPQCGRIFLRKESLRRHLVSHAKGKSSAVQVPLIFYCQHCKMAFAKKNDLRRHLHRTVCRDLMINDNKDLLILPD